MGWVSSLIYGTVGFIVAGPVGAAIGAGIGSVADEDSGNENNQLTPEQQRQMQTFVSMFALSAKIAKADGVVSQEEIDTLNYFMTNTLEFDKDSKNAAIKIFREAKDSPRSFEDFASDYYNVFKYDREHLLMMLELLILVAAADNVYHPNEEKLILSAVSIFKLTMEEYAQIKSKFFEDNDKYYKILNCSKDDSNETIKAKYRKLAIDYHPDKIVSKGLPDEFVNFANAKFQEIQTAYEKIRTERKF